MTALTYDAWSGSRGGSARWPNGGGLVAPSGSRLRMLRPRRHAAAWRWGAATTNAGGGIEASGPADEISMRADELELRALMVAALEGDAPAHKTLLTRLSPNLRAYFKRQLDRSGRGAADAEDLVQETLISVHTQRHTYDPLQPLTPWIYAIARYRLIDYLRRSKAASKDVPIEAAEAALIDTDTAAPDSKIDLERLLAQLSPKARRVIQFVKLDGLSVREAASRSGMSESAIKVTVHRGLKALSRLVRQRSGE